MAGTEGTVNYPTDNGSRHAVGMYDSTDGFFYWFRCTLARLLKVVEQAAPNTAQASVSIPTTAGGTVIKAAVSTRRVLWVRNTGSARMYIGDTGLTSSTGYPVDPGEQVPWASTKACYGLSSSGTLTIYYLDVYD